MGFAPTALVPPGLAAIQRRRGAILAVPLPDGVRKLDREKMTSLGKETVKFFGGSS